MKIPFKKKKSKAGAIASDAGEVLLAVGEAGWLVLELVAAFASDS
jgi:hypothetical protein